MAWCSGVQADEFVHADRMSWRMQDGLVHAGRMGWCGVVRSVRSVVYGGVWCVVCEVCGVVYEVCEMCWCVRCGMVCEV